MDDSTTPDHARPGLRLEMVERINLRHARANLAILLGLAKAKRIEGIAGGFDLPVRAMWSPDKIGGM